MLSEPIEVDSQILVKNDVFGMEQFWGKLTLYEENTNILQSAPVLSVIYLAVKLLNVLMRVCYG